MPIFSVYTFASGSKGNCIYIRLGDDELLIDAGISRKRICAALSELNSDISRIKAIFVTHEHVDHTSGLDMLAKYNNLQIHMTEPSAKLLLSSKKAENIDKCLKIHPLLFTEKIGALTVSSFVTSHDSAASVGYIVTDGTKEHTVGIATDMGFVTDSVREALKTVENVILESNHDENMLLSGPYPYELKKRILSSTGHLSNEAAAELACELISSGTKRILLAHLSEENNLPELAYHSLLCLPGSKCADIFVASPSEITKLVYLE